MLKAGRNLWLDLKHEMMGWTGVQKEIGKDSGVFTHSYQCNRKNIKKNTVICPVVPIPANSLEKYIINFVERLLSNPKQVGRGAPKATRRFQKQLCR